MEELTRMTRMCRHRRSGRHDNRKSRHLIRGTGHNIIAVNVPEKHEKYLADLYTTLIDVQWRLNIFIFVSVFVVTWVMFGFLYYILSSINGDLNPDGRGTNAATPSTNATETMPCIENVHTFTGAYLFSIETMTTIGYGFRYQTEACPGVWLLVMVQSIIGAALQLALASVVVSKTRKARRRTGTVLFSDKVCLHDNKDQLQLAVRIGEMRDSHVAGAHARGFLIKKFKQSDGTYVPVRMYQLSFASECGRDEVFLSWPTQILHTVDEASPLWSLSRDQLLSGRYELIVLVDGTCVTTSTPFQARRSFNTEDMMWGHRFADLHLKLTSHGSYDLDLSTFHNTVPASTVLCSARDMTTLRASYTAHMTSDSAYDTTCTTDTSVLNESPKIPRRSISVGQLIVMSMTPPVSPGAAPKGRRQSLGDLLYTSQRDGVMSAHRGHARNRYRHRKSVTDTYLGSESDLVGITKEDEEEDDAVLTIVSDMSQEKRPDVRDVFRRRRSSVTQLYFAEGHEGVAGGTTQCSTQINAPSEETIRSRKSSATHPNITTVEIYTRRKISGTKTPEKQETSEGVYKRRKSSTTNPYETPVDTYRRRKVSASQAEAIKINRNEKKRRVSAQETYRGAKEEQTRRKSAQEADQVHMHPDMILELEERSRNSSLSKPQDVTGENNPPTEIWSAQDTDRLNTLLNQQVEKEAVTQQEDDSRHAPSAQLDTAHAPHVDQPSTKQPPRRRKATVVQPNLTSLNLTSVGATSLNLTSPDVTSLNLTSPDVTSLKMTSLNGTSLTLTPLGQQDGVNYEETELTTMTSSLA